MGNTVSTKEQALIGCAAIGATAAVTGCVGTFMIIRLLRRISQSVGISKPAETQLQEESPSKYCPLFRHFPELTKQLAWRSLGVTGATPVHKCQMMVKKKKKKKVGDDDVIEEENENKETVQLDFLVKREDLISDQYGGNKVRTLQHQLAVCEARRDGDETAFRHLVSCGSGGSNQIVATVVHSNKLGWDNNNNKGSSSTTATTSTLTSTSSNNNIIPFFFDKDLPDNDNTLNMLSVLSFSNIGTVADWGMTFGFWDKLAGIRNAWTQTELIPMMPGGNCAVGVIGQASGILELAEQISSGASPDPERIYVPIGSSCTISGLILGVCLSRHILKLNAFQSTKFKIVGCNVHHGIATLDRLLSFHTNPLFQFMPLTITYSVLVACKALKEIGGPDMSSIVMKFIKSNVELRSDKDVVGKYGGHSETTRKIAQLYDDTGIVYTDCSTTASSSSISSAGKTKKNEKELWVCGHFVAKALTPLINDLEKEMLLLKTAESKSGDGGDDNTSIPSPPTYMLWMTKSAVQPRGDVDEWLAFQNSTSDAVKVWANEGKAESKLRPCTIYVRNNNDDDHKQVDDDDSGTGGEKKNNKTKSFDQSEYRSVMTKIL